jgi:hypothetical protein
MAGQEGNEFVLPFFVDGVSFEARRARTWAISPVRNRGVSLVS